MTAVVARGAGGQQTSLFDRDPRDRDRRRPRRVGSLIPAALRLDAEEAPRERGLGFTARALVQATLPHSDPGANEFVRRNGRFTLLIVAPGELGLPYGRYPRVVLAYPDARVGGSAAGLVLRPSRPHVLPAALAPGGA